MAATHTQLTPMHSCRTSMLHHTEVQVRSALAELYLCADDHSKIETAVDDFRRAAHQHIAQLQSEWKSSATALEDGNDAHCHSCNRPNKVCHGIFTDRMRCSVDKFAELHAQLSRRVEEQQNSVLPLQKHNRHTHMNTDTDHRGIPPTNNTTTGNANPIASTTRNNMNLNYIRTPGTSGQDNSLKNVVQETKAMLTTELRRMQLTGSALEESSRKLDDVDEAHSRYGLTLAQSLKTVKYLQRRMIEDSTGILFAFWFFIGVCIFIILRRLRLISLGTKVVWLFFRTVVFSNRHLSRVTCWTLRSAQSLYITAKAGWSTGTVQVQQLIIPAVIEQQRQVQFYNLTADCMLQSLSFCCKHHFYTSGGGQQFVLDFLSVCAVAPRIIN
eukprot:Lankesteria_metandrocarpae@DN5398_c0_g1_i7.p1